ncbi:cytochrome P450 [Peniophora sp. CONT]|nr:cytochrome P450 [Peniophora sp. CONT]
MVSPASLLPLVCVLAVCLRLLKAVQSRISKRKALRDVHGPVSASFLTGNLTQVINPDGLEFFDQLLAHHSGVAKLHGLCGDVMLCLSDPVALAHILVNDPDSFPEVDLTGTTQINRFMLGPGLLTTNGPQHRRQRKVLNPVFSSAHMRRISPLVRGIVQQFKDSLVAQVQSSGCTLDIAPSLGHLALELIGRVGFGHSFHALDGGIEGSEYVRAAKELIPALTALGPLMALFVATGLSSLPPRILRLAGDGTSFFIPTLHRFMAIVDTLYATTRDIWESKKAEFAGGDAVLHEAVEEKADLLSVLLKENVLVDERYKLLDDELLSQLNTIVLAGVETTSNALCRTLYLLALHPDMQERLRGEIVHAGQNLDYDALMELPFLDAVCKETLRLYAPLPYRNRIAANEAILPLSNGGVLQIPTGTEILVNCHGLNTDPAVWGSDSREWQPERWFAPLPTVEIPGVYAHSMTFLGGPKACIGFSFSILELKTTLATLLPVFKFAPSEHHEVIWRFGPLISPSIKGEKGLHPKMPLQLQVIDPTAS